MTGYHVGETPRLEGFRYIDKNRKPVVDGTRVEVRHCTGRYGQTTLSKGKLLRITSTSVWIELEEPYYGLNRHCPAGTPFFVSGVFHVDEQESKTLIGYKRHSDFEHGHETWLEQVEEEATAG